MQEMLKLQKKIIPELVDLLEKRYNVLRTIYYNEPIGRRTLAGYLNLSERIVRTEISFLNDQGLIAITFLTNLYKMLVVDIIFIQMI